jgi:serine/threonine-protein kinase
MSERDDGLPPGYTFVRHLGEGGFGEVALARQVSLDRLVAVKRIHQFRLADGESLDRFRREGRLLGSTRCPSVVRVYDLVISSEGAHLVMEYVAGRPLSDLLESGPLPPADALVVLRDVADALAAAFEHGIVHRDIKPANVFVLPTKRAKLGDFGQARIASDPSVFRTTTGQTTGTPAYFPPEVSQHGSEPDERSDAYSFAVMAFETLTGRRPYEADDVDALITAHWRLSPPDPRDLVPGFPPAAAAALLRGMAREPSARLLPSALVDRLAAVPEAAWPAVTRTTRLPSAVEPSGSTVAPPTVVVRTSHPGRTEQTPPPRPGRRSRRRTTLGGIAALAVLLTAGAIAMSSLLSKNSPPAGPLVQRVQLSTVPAPAHVDCPGGTLLLRAVIHTSGAPGKLLISWRQPDGRTTPNRQVDVVEGQREVDASLRLRLRGQRSISGDASIRVRATRTTTARTPVSYTCPSP